MSSIVKIEKIAPSASIVYQFLVFFIGNEGMYSEEKQENKPSVVELGVLCVPWVLRSSGMTAVS